MFKALNVYLAAGLFWVGGSSAFSIPIGSITCPSVAEGIGVTCLSESRLASGQTSIGCNYDRAFYGLGPGPRLPIVDSPDGYAQGRVDCDAVEGKLVGCRELIELVFPSSGGRSVRTSGSCTIEPAPGYGN